MIAWRLRQRSPADPVLGRSARPQLQRHAALTHPTEGSNRKDGSMTITLGLTPLISLIAGILILIIPRLLNYIVALYLIVIGLIGLFGAGTFHF